MDERAALLGCDQDFFDALVAADGTVLTQLLAEDFILVSIADGAVVTKTDLVAAVSSGAVVFPAVQSFPDEAVVRVIGEVGVVVGRTAMTFTGSDATEFTAASRYTHVYAHADGSWRLVSAQGTEIRQ
ncbi:nuclear transport factor 2 family protein [Actinocrispum sp. NPDC049592]|uniref:nuclear transport factor 2 family protein n=1 Tax=Actinocrispum sp. NPDC049592 TaxID=3154835 RepID=UPI00343A1E3C